MLNKSQIFELELFYMFIFHTVTFGIQFQLALSRPEKWNTVVI